MPEFDYWADWLSDRIAGKPIDAALLEQSVLLPDEIAEQSPAAINRYLKRLRDEHLGLAKPEETLQKVTRVRTIFIGNGDAGKTSLIQALNGEQVTAGGTDMTPGIEVSEWPVPASDLTSHFWDFGGQVIAHATHQFFLRARCVYVLVLNARSTDVNPSQQAEYWLEFVRAFGAEAPVIIAGNKCDLVPIALDLNRLRESNRNIVDFFPLSATEYQGEYADHFQRFKHRLVEQLREVGQIQPYFPKNHFKVIDQLREKSRQDPFLKKKRFDALCKAQSIDQPD